MDNLSHNFAQKLGVALLATVLMLGAFSITLFSLDQHDLDKKLGVVKGVSISSNNNVDGFNDDIEEMNELGNIDNEIYAREMTWEDECLSAPGAAITPQGLILRELFCLDRDDNDNLKVRLPDLRPIKLQIRKAEQTDDNRLEAGDNLLVRVAIKNIGHASTTESMYTLEWEADGLISGTVPGLEPGGVFDTDHELTWATDTNELFKFALKADSTEMVDEFNERNNILVKKVRFHYRKCLSSKMPVGENSTSTPPVDLRYCVDWLTDEGEEADDESGEVSSDDIPEHLGVLAEARKGEIIKLRERIRNLQRKIGDLERKFIEREKKLVKAVDKVLTRRLKGKILLQVEGEGEAWYVDEITEERFYLKDGDAAYEALQAFGLGVSNEDLEKIPVGVEDRADRIDTDGDGLDDKLEEAIGTDPNNPDSDGDGFTDGEEVRNKHDALGQRVKQFRQDLADRLEGKILLQVEGNGEAWYVYNGRRHYMKNGRLAYQIMRFLSLGITNDDIQQIPVGELE